MDLHIITPVSKKSIAVAWIEVYTSVGGLVIQPGHAPLITSLKENSQVTICLKSGKIETIDVPRGLFSVNRKEASIIIVM